MYTALIIIALALTPTVVFRQATAQKRTSKSEKILKVCGERGLFACPE